MTKRVIKVGGSLLDWPLLGERLWQWLQQQPPGDNYLLAGGGALADAVRAADAAHHLGEALCHQACVQLMGITGQMLQSILATACAAPNAARDHQRRMSVLDVPALLADDGFVERAGGPLPCSWQVTSDSIAAYIAQCMRAHELVLLKSITLRGSMTFTEASAVNYVDDFFSTAASGVAKVRAVNLRSDRFDEHLLFASGTATTTATSYIR